SLLTSSTTGAFAFFGPGDFQDLYTSLSAPNANCRLHFAGEAISTRHAWVVGALDSAWRAVFEYLLLSYKGHKRNDKLNHFFALWGRNVEWAQLPTKPIHRDGSGGLTIFGDGNGRLPTEGDGSERIGPEDNLLGVHMRYTYAAELSGDIKF
ncbi:hypothetical protein AZE42_01789, partial [Rhizopogon vesiculosus]